MELIKFCRIRKIMVASSSRQPWRPENIWETFELLLDSWMNCATMAECIKLVSGAVSADSHGYIERKSESARISIFLHNLNVKHKSDIAVSSIFGLCLIWLLTAVQPLEAFDQCWDQ